MGYPFTIIIASILWLTLSLISAMEYLPHTKNMGKLELVVFVFIFMIGGPIFGINEVLTTLLESIMPEGWDDDEDRDGKDDFYKRY